MGVDPDGNFVWMLLNAGFAAYDGYQAYKSGGWKAAAIAVGISIVGGAALKGAKIAYRVYEAGKFSKTSRLASKIASHHEGTVIRIKGDGWRVSVLDGKKNKYQIRIMNKGSGGRTKPYYRISHSRYGALDAYGNPTNNGALTHIDITRKLYRQIRNILRR